MSVVALRSATSADIAAITAIYADAVRNGTASYELKPPGEAEMAARFDALTARAYPYLVAEDPSGVLGYAYAGPFRPRPAYRFMVEDSIYMAAEARGKGIGRLLLAMLIEETGKLGFRHMTAVIGDGIHNVPSLRLHAQLGFRHMGVLEGSGFKQGRWLDTVFMQLSMNGGNSTDPDPGSLPERNFRAGI